MKNVATIIWITILLASVPLWTQEIAAADTGVLLAKVERRLQWGREFLSLTHDPQAAAWIAQADTLVNDGRSAFLEKQQQQANQKLTSALDLAERACQQLVDMTAPLTPEQVVELQKQAEGKLVGSDKKRATGLYVRACEYITRAQAASRNNDQEQEKEYLHYADFILEKIIASAVEPSDNINSAEKIPYQDLLQRSLAALRDCRNPRALKLFQQAQQQAENGDEAIARGERQLGMDFYHNGTRLLLRVLNLCQGRESAEPEQIMEELALLGRMVETAAARPRKNLAAEESRFIKRALVLYQQAQAAIQVKDYASAGRHIDLARTLLQRLWEPAPTGRRLEQEMAHLQSAINAARQSLPAEESPRRQLLLAEAERYLQTTNRLQQNKRIRMAWISYLVANRFFNLFQTGAAAVRPSESNLDQDLDQLQERLGRHADTDDDRELIRLAQSLYDQARSLWQKQDALAQPFYQMSRLILDKIDLLEISNQIKE